MKYQTLVATRVIAKLCPKYGNTKQNQNIYPSLNVSTTLDIKIKKLKYKFRYRLMSKVKITEIK